MQLPVEGDDWTSQPPAALPFPEEVTLDGTTYRSYMTFKIQDELSCGNFGEIELALWSYAAQFYMRDASGRQIAVARKSRWPWGVSIGVFDEANRLLATVEERIFGSFGKIYSTYDIKAPDGTILGTSEKSELVGTQFSVKDTKQRPLADMDRDRFFSLGDTWHVKFYDQTQIDSRVLLFLPAFKSLADEQHE